MNIITEINLQKLSEWRDPSHRFEGLHLSQIDLKCHKFINFPRKLEKCNILRITSSKKKTASATSQAPMYDKLRNHIIVGAVCCKLPTGFMFGIFSFQKVFLQLIKHPYTINAIIAILQAQSLCKIVNFRFLDFVPSKKKTKHSCTINCIIATLQAQRGKNRVLIGFLRLVPSKKYLYNLSSTYVL